MAGPAWLWIRESGAEVWAEGARALSDAGFACADVELDVTSDRASLARIEAALRELGARADVDERNLGVIGIGLGGTLALLAGCTSRRVRAVACLQPVLVFEELSASRPFQPIELLLNLDVPLLAVFGGRDGRTTPAHVASFRRQCELGAKHVELVEFADGGLELFGAPNEARRASDAHAALARVLAFAADTFQ
ncbi:MAG: hypothetical protein FJ298_09035 [Planctomycetes bacterium]|nr:hypothetical protein [Planctomycetota bacterium]